MAPDTGTAAACQLDPAYEFDAPRFFDFINEEKEEAVRAAEAWFEASASHAPSPFGTRIRETRAVPKVTFVCDFAGAEEPATEVRIRIEYVPPWRTLSMRRGLQDPRRDVSGSPPEMKNASFGSVCEDNISVTCADAGSHQQEASAACPEEMSESPPADTMSESPPAEEEKEDSPKSFEFQPIREPTVKSDGGSASTPKMQRPPPPIKIAPAVHTCAKSIVKTEVRTPKTLANTSKEGAATGSMVVKRSVMKGTRDLAAADVTQENQAVKRQKLDNGGVRQILNVKTRVLPHKGRAGLAGSIEMRRSHESMHSTKEVAPYISAAEIVKKFESGTRELSTPHSRSHEDTSATLQNRPQLMLTRPKEPEFQTAHRVRAVRVKSSAELEEEMLAKIPKFRARPFNKKIAEAPVFPPLPRQTPQEFHLKTMERATRHADTSSETSFVGTVKSQNKPLKSTAPKPPQLHTAMRARPPSVKSSQELELEELEKVPKFKAKPLNKKILESKGDIGLFPHPKTQAVPSAESSRTVRGLGKGFSGRPYPRLCNAGRPRLEPGTCWLQALSLYSESSSHSDRKGVPRLTIPNPFNLHTEERGQLKEAQLAALLAQKQMEEEKARLHKANPYPYTTDYPVVPPKPEPKPCTRPEGFQLESLVRHEIEQQRLMEERQRMEREEAQRRLIKEKEKTYKRLREENEFAQKIEEEKALKQLRRTMVDKASDPAKVTAASGGREGSTKAFFR
ncbi:hypothetical protein PR202_ga31459 [Eleusine coracana subsp. coracana]|uniref:TPX2 central domain-containing protein n=1 Tax=Eleusine coracana subsp. coracana TaxID=191504 RepID=A0AAV5DQ99_ELECO|nr:hypothetical protein PR202_ga31459 [Eleusine coracana subsp. coracana]